MFRFECDKVYELYGYRADETYTFPIEAYYLNFPEKLHSSAMRPAGRS